MYLISNYFKSQFFQYFPDSFGSAIKLYCVGPEFPADTVIATLLFKVRWRETKFYIIFIDIVRVIHSRPDDLFFLFTCPVNRQNRLSRFRNVFRILVLERKIEVFCQRIDDHRGPIRFSVGRITCNMWCRQECLAHQVEI